jgi:hypothetical protein
MYGRASHIPLDALPRPRLMHRGRLDVAVFLEAVTDGGNEETAMEHVQNLVRLVEKLEREAKQASRTCGRRELDRLEVTAEQYLTLYRALKVRGEIE